MDNIKEWLAKPCNEETEVAYLDADKTIAYIPVGICQEILDEGFDRWEMEDYRFQIIRIDKYWFASGSATLVVAWYEEGHPYLITRRLTGSCTMRIASTDDNTDYEATVLSFCISNAAKKLGKRFGRHLNGRTEIAERQMEAPKKSNDKVVSAEEIDQQYTEIRKVLEQIEFREDAQLYLDTTGFKHTIEAKLIVNNKPSKK